MSFPIVDGTCKVSKICYLVTLIKNTIHLAVDSIRFRASNVTDIK